MGRKIGGGGQCLVLLALATIFALGACRNSLNSSGFSGGDDDTPPTVTFNANPPHSSVTIGGSMESQEVAVGSALPQCEFAAPTGWAFAGWAESPTGEVAHADEEEITISAGKTLYAKWKIKGTASEVNGVLSTLISAGGEWDAEVTEGDLSDLTAEAVLTVTDRKVRLDLSALNDLTEIAEEQFYSCPSLSSVVLPENVTKIGNSAFCECTGLSRIDIPSGVTSIKEEAFCNCSLLADATLPSDLTEIGKNAFAQTALTAVAIPSGVTEIGERAFSQCASLSSVTLTSGLERIGDQAFYNCESLSSVALPAGLEEIGGEAFAYCPLASVTIPAGVNDIGNDAFANTNLSSATFESKSDWYYWSDEADDGEGAFVKMEEDDLGNTSTAATWLKGGTHLQVMV